MVDDTQDSWFEQIAEACDAELVVMESRNFRFLMPYNYPQENVRSLSKMADDVLEHVVGILHGVIEGLPENKIIVLLFHSDASYRDYLVSQIVGIDIDGVSSSGLIVQVQGKPLHLAIATQHLQISEGFLAHELTRFLLLAHSIPVWLEEGLSTLAEYEITGAPQPPLDSIDDLRNFWTPEKIQGFWDGSAFYQLDGTNDISNDTAVLLVYALIRTYPFDVFADFVKSASNNDAGQAAAIEKFGVGLGDLFLLATNTQINDLELGGLVSKPTSIFRILLLTAAICNTIWFFYYYIVPLSDAEARLVAIDGYGGFVPVQHPFFYWGWFAIWLFATSGMFFFRNWARHLYLALSVVGQLLLPFSGYVTALPFDYFLSTTFLLLSGVILGMAYFSVLMEKFGSSEAPHVARGRRGQSFTL